MAASNRTRAFISYSHMDKRHLERLHKHLAHYVLKGTIDFWDDTKIKPGSHWREDIKQIIASAKVAILLVSADFLASEFITHDELPPLLVAAKEEGATILPVILSPCAFNHSELAHFQAVNDSSKPLIGMTKARQEALWAYVAECVKDALSETPAPMSQQPELQAAIDSQSAEQSIPSEPLFKEEEQQEVPVPQKTVEEWLEEAEYNQDEEPGRMLFACEQALQLDPENDYAYYLKGVALSMLDLDEGALMAFEKVIELDPSFYGVYEDKYYSLKKLERYKEALDCCRLVLKERYYQQEQSEESRGEWYTKAADMLYNLGRRDEAVDAYKKALSHFPESRLHLSSGISKAGIYKRLSDALLYLGRVEEGITAYREAAKYLSMKDDDWIPF